MDVFSVNEIIEAYKRGLEDGRRENQQESDPINRYLRIQVEKTQPNLDINEKDIEKVIVNKSFYRPVDETVKPV